MKKAVVTLLLGSVVGARRWYVRSKWRARQVKLMGAALTLHLQEKEPWSVWQLSDAAALDVCGLASEQDAAERVARFLEMSYDRGYVVLVGERDGGDHFRPVKVWMLTDRGQQRFSRFAA